MNASDPFKTLRDSRAALLACEAIGWLHMAGKAHPNFVKQQASDATKGGTTCDELKWAKNVISKFGTLPNVSGQVITPSDLFEKHRDRSDGLLGLLQAAHAMASGIEKNHAKNASAYLGQTNANMWLTTAFGHPVQNLLGNTPPTIAANDAWSNIEAQIGTLIDGLAARLNDPTDLNEWFKWRNGAIGSAGWLREAFTNTLAETRVPNNDVTLWDQSFIAAALFKAAAAGAVLTGTSFEWGNCSKFNTCWRVLTVGIGAEHYEARAVRVGDWTGTRDAIAAFFDEVSEFIEVDLVIGACVYRDERTLSFTFPGQRFDSKGSVDDALAEILRINIETEVDNLAKKHAFETPPLVRLSSSTRSFISMSRELADARRVLEVPVHRPWSIASDGSKGKHVCPVTLVRAGEPSNQGSDRKQDVSKSAYDRRTGRRAVWERNGGDTIWISEVADENDRVALLTFSLGLEGWLDGTHVDSLRAQCVVEWRANNPTLTTIDASKPRDSFWAHVESFVKNPTLKNGKLSDAVLRNLSDGFAHEISLENFFHKVVEDRAGAPAWSSLDDATRAAWLTHQLFRKNASPGRVHRFWRTTRAFFAEALEEFRTLITGQGGSRTQRLSLTISSNTSGLRVGEVYAGQLPFAPNAPFEILRRQNDFVTVCNLARVFGPNWDTAQLKGTKFEARGDDGVRHQFTIDDVIPTDGVLASYRPLIVLEENPERFRVLVPLSSADACVEHVVAKWRHEMARVWDRLPLRIGIIGFPRKTPFQAVIEASRNIEDDLAAGSTEEWCVTSIATQAATTAQPPKTVLSFERPDKGREVVEVPAQIADGRDDVYYSNLAVVDAEREPHDFSAPRPDGSSVVYRRAADLKPNVKVWVEPSRYASVFIDSTARRFEPVEVYPLSEWDRCREVWALVKKAAPSLTTALAVEHSLTDARRRWTDADIALDETAWGAWARAVLANEWNASEDQLIELEAAARDGLLKRVLSWHLHVLKQKIGATL
jgi:CRISPR-associated Csx11 family protein